MRSLIAILTAAAVTHAGMAQAADPKRPDYLTFKTEKQHAYILRGD